MASHGPIIAPGTTASAFWEERYRAGPPRGNGRPSASLVRFASGLAPGRALELGCARGDDAVWLARRGWRVLAVDVSATALGYAEANAREAGVADRVTFERHDLAETAPAGAFDLVSAQFLESPVDFPRARVLRRAAGAVAPGGLLLVAAHGSAPPWAWGDHARAFPTPEEALGDLALDPAEWARDFVGAPEREARGPDGQAAMVRDVVLALRRR